MSEKKLEEYPVNIQWRHRELEAEIRTNEANILRDETEVLKFHEKIEARKAGIEKSRVTIETLREKQRQLLYEKPQVSEE